MKVPFYLFLLFWFEVPLGSHYCSVVVYPDDFGDKLSALFMANKLDTKGKIGKMSMLE